MLHTVNKSPFEKTSLTTCLRLSAAGSVILLLEDGVYAAMRDTEFTDLVCAQMKHKKFYALAADVQARGLHKVCLIDGVELIGYDEFVQLVVRCSKVQNWF